MRSSPAPTRQASQGLAAAATGAQPALVSASSQGEGGDCSRRRASHRGRLVLAGAVSALVPGAGGDAGAAGLTAARGGAGGAAARAVVAAGVVTAAAAVQQPSIASARGSTNDRPARVPIVGRRRSVSTCAREALCGAPDGRTQRRDVRRRTLASAHAGALSRNLPQQLAVWDFCA
jgi:hypothetical protein